MVEWFPSPLTNRRTDEYGGGFSGRVRFATEILQAIRDEVGSTMTIGVRMNLEQELPGGFDLAGGIELARYYESTGLVDYLHVVMGSPWGNPSYIQSHYYQPAQWREPAGALRAVVSLPVVHTGRINSPEAAEQVLAGGSADVVGMARAHIAEPELLVKARAGRTQDIRPCVGGNECISRRYVEGLSFGCPVNPHASKEVDGPWPVAARPVRSWSSAGDRPAWSWPRWPAAAGTTSSCGRPATSSAGSSGSPPPRPTTSTTAISTGSSAGWPSWG